MTGAVVFKGTGTFFETWWGSRERGFRMDERCDASRELMKRESCVTERVDAEGNRWYKAYCGGGAHFQNWLEQCRELGDVVVEEIDARGWECFERGGERLYRIWIRMEGTA